jgi:hypothetical protein
MSIVEIGVEYAPATTLPDIPDPSLYYVDVFFWRFDTDTYEVSRSGLAYTSGYTNGTDFPQNEILLENGTFLVSYCEAGTLYSYISTLTYNEVQTSITPDAPACATSNGSCLLVVGYSLNPAQTELTLQPQPGTYTGPLRYTSDNGENWQDSPVFAVQAGSLVFAAEDLGVVGGNCYATVNLENTPPDDGGNGGNGGVVVPPPGGVGAFPAPTTTESNLVHRVESPAYMVIANQPVGQLVQLDLVVEQGAHRSGDFKSVFQARKYADETGTVYFRVDEQLRSQLRREVPRVNGGVPYFDNQVVRNFYGVANKINPGNVVAGTVVTSLQSATLAALPILDNWLTNQPTTKTVAIGQPEFLYFQLPAGMPATTLQVARQVTLASIGGVPSVPTVTKQAVETGSNAGFRVLVVPVFGPSFPSAARHLEIWLENAEGNRLTSYRAYTIEARGGEPVRTFLFGNPFGGIDTLVTTGPGNVKLVADQDTATRGRLPLDSRASAQDFIYTLVPKRTWRVGSGWLTLAQRHWLQGFVLARHVWFARRGTLVPIVPTKRELVYETDARQLDGLSFEFTLASDLAHLAELN